MGFFSKFGDRLAILELLEVNYHRLDVELQVELKAGNDGRDIVKLVQLVVKVLVDELFADILLFKFTDQFRD